MTSLWVLGVKTSCSENALKWCLCFTDPGKCDFKKKVCVCIILINLNMCCNTLYLLSRYTGKRVLIELCCLLRRHRNSWKPVLTSPWMLLNPPLIILQKLCWLDNEYFAFHNSVHIDNDADNKQLAQEEEIRIGNLR